MKNEETKMTQIVARKNSTAISYCFVGFFILHSSFFI